MSKVSSLRVRNLRTHATYTLQVSPTVTLITGPNGSGKTSLIEALHIAFQGSSFKGSDTEVLARDAPWYRIDVMFDDKSLRTVKFDPSRTSGRKQFIINDKPHYRLTFAYKHPVVLFEPEDLRLLNGSPTRRRQFIDSFIGQLDPGYNTILHRYERALKQRNSLLKQSRYTSDDIFAWNVSLSEYGSVIIEKRQEFIESLNNQLQTVYQSISKTADNVTISYSYNYTGNISQRLLTELHAHSERDTLLGYTSVGPHRHDVLFDFNGSPAMTVASRGEIRTIVLALKFLEVSIIEALTDKQPIILLDDVFSELDDNRQESLIREFKQYQIIIASVAALPVDGAVVDILTKD
jgi:DNA replication and repair protein RecF